MINSNLIRIFSYFVLLQLIYLPISKAEGFSEKKFLILQSHYSRIKAGELVSSTTTINLAPKQLIRILGPSGEITKIQGKYSGSIGFFLRDGKGTEINLFDLGNAIKGHGQLRKALGGYRGSDEERDAPRYNDSIVRIIVGENQAYCVSNGQQLVLWRPDKTINSIKLKLGAGNIRKEVKWLAGEKELRLSDEIVNSKPRRIVLLSHGDYSSTRARMWYGEKGLLPGKQLLWYQSMGCDLQFESALMFYQTF